MKDIFNGHGIIISAECADLDTETNAKRSAVMVSQLIDIIGWDGAVIPCRGSYDGLEEQSYLVLIKDEIAEDTVACGLITRKILALAYRYSQEAVIVFSPDSARLLELPDMELEGEFTDEEIGETIATIYTLTNGGGYISDPMEFVHRPYEAIEAFDSDFTEVMGQYYTLEY